MTRVVRGPRFVDDLTDAYDYLSSQSTTAPGRLLRAIDRLASNLAAFPETGAPRPNIDPVIRMHRVRGFAYLVFYDYADDVVTLVRLLHGARNLRKDFKR